MRYVAPELMSEAQLTQLVSSGAVGGWSAADIAVKLLSGRWRAFACWDGMIAVSTAERRMTVEALAIPRFGWRMRRFRDLMDRLAGDMGCDTVETDCFDPRLAKAMMRIRAKPVRWTMLWQVEGTARGQ